MDQVHPGRCRGYGRLLADLCAERITRAVSTQRYRRKDGNWIWVEVNFNLTYDADNERATGYVAAARDISARKEAEFQIAHMARHDALTDLANRTLFRERLVQELAMSQRRGASFAVLCLDLDRFKFVNDTLGHQAATSCCEPSRAVCGPWSVRGHGGADRRRRVHDHPDRPRGGKQHPTLPSA